MSQNLLSNTEAFAFYGWNRDEGSLVKAGLRYDGWGVRLGFSASYGGNRIVYGLGAHAPETAKYHSFDVSASLPLLFQRGYHTRRLTLSANWNYSNGKVADLGAIRWDENGGIANIDAIGYRDGLHKLSFSVSYYEQVRMAYRDFLPRFGWQLLANCSFNPTNDDFSKLLAAYGQIYLPGFAPHHSLNSGSLSDFGGRRSLRTRVPAAELSVVCLDSGRIRLVGHRIRSLSGCSGRLPTTGVVSRRRHLCDSLYQTYPTEPRRPSGAIPHTGRGPDAPTPHLVGGRRSDFRFQRHPHTGQLHLDFQTLGLSPVDRRSVGRRFAGIAVLTMSGTQTSDRIADKFAFALAYSYLWLKFFMLWRNANHRRASTRGKSNTSGISLSRPSHWSQ